MIILCEVLVWVCLHPLYVLHYVNFPKTCLLDFSVWYIYIINYNILYTYLMLTLRIFVLCCLQSCESIEYSLVFQDQWLRQSLNPRKRRVYSLTGHENVHLRRSQCSSWIARPVSYLMPILLLYYIVSPCLIA